MIPSQNAHTTPTASCHFADAPELAQRTVPTDAPLAADAKSSLNAALPVLEDEVDRAARRLVRRLGLPPADLDDLRQDLLLDLIHRFPAFDPARGTLGAFAGAVVRNEASRVASRIFRERRRWNGPLDSLEDASDAEVGVGDRFAESDGLAVWHGQRIHDATTIVARLDLDRGIDRLSRDERTLYDASNVHSVQQLVAVGFGSRATVYRRLHDLRCVLAASGIAA
jgi:RNA polymerase sigma-70 factor (ECF subfamily)